MADNPLAGIFSPQNEAQLAERLRDLNDSDLIDAWDLSPPGMHEKFPHDVKRRLVKLRSTNPPTDANVVTQNTVTNNGTADEIAEAKARNAAELARRREESRQANGLSTPKGQKQGIPAATALASGLPNTGGAIHNPGPPIKAADFFANQAALAASQQSAAPFRQTEDDFVTSVRQSIMPKWVAKAKDKVAKAQKAGLTMGGMTEKLAKIVEGTEKGIEREIRKAIKNDSTADKRMLRLMEDIAKNTKQNPKNQKTMEELAAAIKEMTDEEIDKGVATENREAAKRNKDAPGGVSDYMTTQHQAIWAISKNAAGWAGKKLNAGVDRLMDSMAARKVSRDSTMAVAYQNSPSFVGPQLPGSQETNISTNDTTSVTNNSSSQTSSVVTSIKELVSVVKKMISNKPADSTQTIDVDGDGQDDRTEGAKRSSGGLFSKFKSLLGGSAAATVAASPTAASASGGGGVGLGDLLSLGRGGLGKVAGLARMALPYALPAAGVAAAGYAGYKVGSAINDNIIQPGMEALTGVKGESLGTGLYSMVDSIKGLVGASDADKSKAAEKAAAQETYNKRIASGEKLSPRQAAYYKSMGIDVPDNVIDPNKTTPSASTNATAVSAEKVVKAGEISTRSKSSDNLSKVESAAATNDALKIQNDTTKHQQVVNAPKSTTNNMVAPQSSPRIDLSSRNPESSLRRYLDSRTVFA